MGGAVVINMHCGSAKSGILDGNIILRHACTSTSREASTLGQNMSRQFWYHRFAMSEERREDPLVKPGGNNGFRDIYRSMPI